MFRLIAAACTVVLVGVPLFAQTPFISDAIGPNNAANRAATDALDDPWLAAVEAATTCPDGEELVFDVGIISDAALPNALTTGDGTSVTFSLRNMTNGTLGTANGSQGGAVGSSSTNLQDGSPKPLSSVGDEYYNETVGSTTSPNGFLYTFAPPATNFGAFHGDLETRTEPRDDGFPCSPSDGTTAVLRLIDENGVVTDIDIPPNASEDQALCGSPVNDSFAGCGNRQTRWVGFTSATPIEHMIVIVGDDDTTCNGTPSDNAGREHISFIAPTMGTCQVNLPIELIAFNAIVSGQDVELAWSTASEMDNAGFEIESARPDGSFARIDYVTGQGDNQARTDYAYTVKNLTPGEHRFRLRQIDTDGTTTFSQVVTTQIDFPDEIVLGAPYPNPFFASTTLSLGSRSDQDVRVTIYNSLGQEVRTLVRRISAGGVVDVTLDSTGLTSGVYLVRATSANAVVQRSVVLVR